jgi:hypothetical protein
MSFLICSARALTDTHRHPGLFSAHRCWGLARNDATGDNPSRAGASRWDTSSATSAAEGAGGTGALPPREEAEADRCVAGKLATTPPVECVCQSSSPLHTFTSAPGPELNHKFGQGLRRRRGRRAGLGLHLLGLLLLLLLLGDLLLVVNVQRKPRFTNIRQGGGGWRESPRFGKQTCCPGHPQPPWPAPQ